MIEMRDLRGKARAKSVSDAERRLDEPRPLQRVDSGLLAVLAGVIALAAGGSYAAASWIAASGRLDPPLVKEVEDPRILADYRANLSEMQDMVGLGDELLIGRKDGSIDRFDMAGRTFAAESLPRDGQFSGDLQLLSTDCPAEGCGAGATAYAVTAAGGLAERRNGTWRVILGDGAFRGRDGKPVEQEDVIGWAASQDGRLVLVNAGDKGIGLFNQRKGIWHARPGIIAANQGPLFHDGAFWLGAKDGLHRLAVSERGFAGTPSLVPGTEGEILDLALSETDGLLVLRRGDCTNAGSGCQSLLAVAGEGKVRTLLAEIELDPRLNDSGLRHMVRQGEDLLTLGMAGVHRYSARSRQWITIAPQEPTAHFAEAAGARLHVGLPDRFVTIAGGEVAATTALDAPLRQILPGNGTEVFGLDAKGRVLRLGGATPVVLAEADAGIPQGASFARAAALGPLFVALGPEGVLVHDTQARRYSFTPASALPPMSVADALLVPGTGRLWIVARRSGQVQSLKIEGEFPAKQLTLDDHGSAQTAIVQAHATGDGLDLVAGDGTLLRLNAAGQIDPMVGPGVTESLRPVSMAAAGSAYFFASDDRVWRYDEANGAWRGPDPAPQDGAGLTDIAVAGDRLVALDRDGTVYWRATDGWRQVYGGPLRSKFGADAVQDAFASGRTLFMASDDTVQAYVPDQRSFGASWTMAGQNAELLGIAGDVPLWTNSRGVYLGEEPVFGGAEFIDGWMGASGPVAMGQREGRRYVSAGQSCVYMGVAAPRGEIRDVVPLGEDRLLVRTAAEAGIYEPGLHRWLRVTGLRADTDSRLMRMGAHLVRLDPTGLASVPVSAVARVTSCASTDVAIDWQVEFSGVQATRVDGAPQVLILKRDGGLHRWTNGAVTLVAPPVGEAPEMAGLHKAYAAAGGGIRLLKPDALWHYDLPNRTWDEQEFTGAPRDVRQFDLIETGAGPLISLWDERGDLWRGRATGAGSIAFERVTRPVLPVIPVEPAQIRDMASFGDSIAVLSDRRLMIFPPDQESARADIALPTPQRGWQLASDASGDLVLVDGAVEAPVAIYRIERAVGGKADLSAVAARYTPGDDRDYAYSRTGSDVELFRIDRALNAWRCRPIRGQAAPDCELLAGPPMQITANDIRAFDEAARLLLTGDALWRLDDALRPQFRIEGLNVGSNSVLLRKDLELMLWEKPGGALWRVTRNRAEEILPRVDFLREVDGGYAALVGSEVKGIRNGRLVNLQASDQVDGDLVARAHFTWRGHVTLSQGGVASADSGRVRSDPLISFNPEAVAVLPVPDQGAGPQRWLKAARGGELSLIWADKCEVPAPPQPPVPPEFIGPPAPVVPQPPVIEPCVMTRELPVRLEAGEHVMDLESALPDGFSILTNRRQITLDPGEDALVETSATTPPRNDKSGPEALIGKLAIIDGRSYLNPPRLAPEAMTGLASNIPISRLVPSALGAYDNGWISWQRDGNRIRMSGADQPIDMVPADALRDGRFLPAHPARGAALADGQVAWVNAFGLWHQDGRSMRLVSANGMTMPQALDQGVFLDASQGIAASSGTIGPGLAPRLLQADALEFNIDPLHQRLAATITVAGRKVQALATEGFLHDQRQSVAQAGSEAVYLTPVGLIPQAQLGGGVAAPAGAQRLEAEQGRIPARTPAGWVMQDAAGQWRASPAPFLNELLAEENGRIWERSNGAIALRSANPGQDWHLSRQGLDFDIDQLLAFAATPQGAVAVTRLGTHAAPEIDGLRGVSAPVAPAPGAGELDALRTAPGRFVLFHKEGARYLVWDLSASRWRPPLPDERPWEARDMASVAGVSAAFRGTVGFEVAAEVVGQGAAPLPFSWQAGEVMPFDDATAIHGDNQDGALLVGTRLGLRRVTPAADGYANQQLFVLPGASGTGVRSIGRPAAAPDRILVAYETGCAQLASAAAAPVACSNASGLSERFVAQTGYWRWTKSDRSVAGEYLLADGTRLPLNQPFRGRLPHDSLVDSLSCAGLQARLWRDADVLRIAGTQHRIPGIQGLFCQTVQAPLSGGATLAPGLYVQTTGGALRVDSAGLTPVGALEAQAIADRVSGRVVLETGRLRYGVDQSELTAERLTLAQEWQPVPWQGGRLVLDQPRALAWHGRGLQMVTDAGVFDAPQGRLEPARLVAMQGPDEAALATCAAERVEVLDGRSHGLAGEPGQPLRLYCKDGTWLAGPADNRKDLDAFAPTNALGSQRLLVDAAPMWKVVQDVDAMGNVRSMGITFRDEPARLAAGRFDFDAFRAIAAPFEGRTELLSDTGLWRAPSGVPLLASTERPQSPQLSPRDVSGVSSDRSARNGAMGLCLGLPGGKSLWWNGGSAVEATAACREVRGNDPLWSWWDIGGQPQAETLSTSGALLERRIAAGRFQDLDVRGAPLSDPQGRLLVPGGLGVLVMDPKLVQPIAIHAGPGEVLLTRAADGGVVQLDNAGAQHLGAEPASVSPETLACPALARLAAAIPEGYRLTRADMLPAGRASAMTLGPDGARQVLLQCADPEPGREWTAAVDISAHPRALAIAPGRATTLAVSLTKDGVELHDGGKQAVISTPVRGARAILPRPDGNEILVIDDQSLLSVSVSAAIGMLHQQGRAPGPVPDSDTLPPPSDPTAPSILADRPTSEPPRPVRPNRPRLPLASADSAQSEPPYDRAAVQQALADALGIEMQIDGVIGPDTRRAIAEWQARLGSVATGYLSQAQLQRLLAEET